MKYGIILASGKGTRMNGVYTLPKQFVDISGIPTIIYTVRNMLKIKTFNLIYLVVPEDFIGYSKDLIEKYIIDKKEQQTIKIISGGKERMDSITNAINDIKNNNEITDEDIIVIHDGVRPFVTEKILLDSIEGAKMYGAVVAAIPVSDTLLISEDGEEVLEIPPRKLYYKGQAPDSFRLKLFIELLEKLSAEDYQKITGTSQVCTLNNYPIHMILGDEINFKITTVSDFIIANNIAKGSEKNDK